MNNSTPRRAYRALRSFIQPSPQSLPASIEVDGIGSLQLTPVEQVAKTVRVASGDQVQVIAESINTDASQEGAALLQIVFRDEDGVPVHMDGWPHTSARVGEYMYLQNTMPGGAALTVFEMEAPENSHTLDLIGHRWKNTINTSIVDEIIVNIPNRPPVLQTALGTDVAVRSSIFSQSIDVPTSGEITLAVHATGSENGGGAPLRVRQLDSDGKELLPNASLQQNPQIGPMLLLETKPNEHTTHRFSLTVDKSASTLHIAGTDWGKKTPYIRGPIDVFSNDVSNTTVEDFVDNLDSKTPLYVVDTTAPPLGHKTLALRPNNLAYEYAKQGKAVIFLPFGSLQGHEPDQSPNLYQVQRQEADALMTSLKHHRNGLENYYICSSFPSLQAITTATRLKSLGWKIIYEVRDDMEEFNRVGYSKWYHSRLESEMIRLSDEIVTVSDALADKIQSLMPRETEKTVHVVPNAVNSKVIDKSRFLRTPSSAQASGRSGNIGYVGHLTPSWFDWQLLIAAAESRPHLKFHIVGHGAPENLTLPSNIDLLGPRTHDEVLEIVGDWQVGLIPFIHSPLTRSVDPNKIYEYFAWGLRCVTAEMGRVRQYPSTWVYDDLESMCEALDEATAEPMSEEELQTLNRFLETASWSHRASTMIDLIERPY